MFWRVNKDRHESDAVMSAVASSLHAARCASERSHSSVSRVPSLAENDLSGANVDKRQSWVVLSVGVLVSVPLLKKQKKQTHKQQYLYFVQASPSIRSTDPNTLNSYIFCPTLYMNS